MSKKIFITGGTGFIGSYIIRYLIKDKSCIVRALKRPNSPMHLVKDIQDQIEWIEGDLLDTVALEDAMQDVDEVYHCGAVVSFEPKIFKRMYRVNQEGTANIVNTALHFEVKKFAHLSSIAALGRFKHIDHYDEKTKWETSEYNSQYAISKHMAEQEVWRGIAEGLNAVIVNPAVVLGSGIWGTSTATLFETVWKGLRFFPGGTTGFVDVRDVAKFTIQLMNSDISSERFVLNSENWSYEKLFGTMATAMGKMPPSIKPNEFMTALGWRGDWFLSMLTGKKRSLTKEMAKHVSRQYTYGNEKSLAALDFEYTPIEQTIFETCQQFMQSKKDGNLAAILPLS